jgi:ABC-type polysaccharide/polyol phosphate export permease
MPHIRFRIRTIMITIAVVAILMGIHRFSRGVPVDAGAVLLLLVLLVGVFVEFAVFCAYFWPGTRPHDQYLRRIKYRARIKQAEPKRGGRESVG